MSVLLGGQIELALASVKKNTKPKPPTFGSVLPRLTVKETECFASTVSADVQCSSRMENDIPREPEDGDWCLTRSKSG